MISLKSNTGLDEGKDTSSNKRQVSHTKPCLDKKDQDYGYGEFIEDHWKNIKWSHQP